jgi:hypothetical protein
MASIENPVQVFSIPPITQEIFSLALLPRKGKKSEE